MRSQSKAGFFELPVVDGDDNPPWIKVRLEPTLSKFADVLIEARDIITHTRRPKEIEVGDFVLHGSIPTSKNPSKVIWCNPRFILLQCDSDPWNGQEPYVRERTRYRVAYLDASGIWK